MRLIGRTQWAGGKDSEALNRALNEIHYAFVRTQFKDRDKRYVEHSFNIFSEVYIERRERSTDPIEACTVTLARPIMASLQDGHFTCLNHTLMQELGTIGQALFMRLFFHFANLYDGHHKKRLTFVKRYDDICIEWLGGLRVLKYPSEIERDQLGSHLRQLLQARFLASYTIGPAKGREGLVITFRPGPKFFDDYDRFYRHQQAPTLRFESHDNDHEIAEPLKVAYMFFEKKTGKRQSDVRYVSSNDVKTARYFLTHLPIEQMLEFIDYGLAQAKRTHFEVQSLGGLKQYLPDYLQCESDRAIAQVMQAKKREEEEATRQRIEYSNFRRLEADRIFKTLSVREQADIEKEVRSKTFPYRRGTGSLAQIVFEIERAKITAERHSRRIKTFEQWKLRSLS